MFTVWAMFTITVNMALTVNLDQAVTPQKTP